MVILKNKSVYKGVKKGKKEKRGEALTSGRMYNA